MATGIWINRDGNLVSVLGGARAVLKEVAPILIEAAADTAAHTVNVGSFGGTTTMVAQDNSNAAQGDNSGEFVTAHADNEAGTLSYQFIATGKAAELRALLF